MSTTPLPLVALLAIACGGDFEPPMEPPHTGDTGETGLTPPMTRPPDSGDTGLTPPMEPPDTGDTATSHGTGTTIVPPMPYPHTGDTGTGLTPPMEYPPDTGTGPVPPMPYPGTGAPVVAGPRLPGLSPLPSVDPLIP